MCNHCKINSSYIVAFYFPSLCIIFLVSANNVTNRSVASGDCPRIVTVSCGLTVDQKESWSDWKKKLGQFDLTRYDNDGYAIYEHGRDMFYHVSGVWLVSLNEQ